MTTIFGNQIINRDYVKSYIFSVIKKIPKQTHILTMFWSVLQFREALKCDKCHSFIGFPWHILKLKTKQFFHLANVLFARGAGWATIPSIVICIIILSYVLRLSFNILYIFEDITFSESICIQTIYINIKYM